MADQERPVLTLAAASGTKVADLEMEIAILKDQLGRAERRCEELTALADKDPLTDVLNKRAFVREVSRAAAGFRRHGHAAMLVVVDVTGLGEMNAQHGDAAGDAALRHLGMGLFGHVRDTDAVGRIGMDEFGVLLAFADEAGAQRKITRLIAKIAETPVAGTKAPIRVQARFAAAPLCADEPHQQIDALRAALHGTGSRAAEASQRASA
jgi:diguanylate cyclase (GGDEF)-like protein